MITQKNISALLLHLGFTESNSIFKRDYSQGASIEVNFVSQKITYSPLDSDFKEGEYPTKDKPAKGFVIHRDTTLNFSANESFVCLVCVHLLLKKGYEPKHIVFEPAFKVGHVNKPSYGDILVFDKEYHPLVLIENKTYGSEFSAEWNNMQKDGGQLFSYLGPLVNSLGFCENLVLFAADYDEKEILKNHIITLKDNDKRLKELDNPKTFSNAQGRYFDVWSETYAKSFETKGLFEDDIAPYSIGKLKYTINDLKGLSHAEIRPIYHEFATILRNHAITDFEHSFYILIDLFLCKITDERNNPNDLQFFYKGITRDTPKEYCARLLNLYQQGKKQLFGIDVVNKNESDISQIFEDTNRSVTNGLFAGIKELFEEIKFYNIKKFNFIDVENKEEFEMNFQILIKIASLIQDINLSNSETNHFFGDLFEGLLSRNVHQTEGQFFTPLPIVNFIIKSLPQFPNSSNVKVLDYACGAGHFLTEFIKSYPQADAYGIEKSQPLSQVAKIATIINGAKDSHIVFKDSLSIFNTAEVRFQGFDRENFDCIIANPPYSVKGFLNTLSDNDRQQFNLIKFVKEKSYGSNDSIECFFIERTKHFLQPNGLVGIILPGSILSNGNLYTKARELLFESFNLLAIVNLNSRTFGSTGTNTIVLFAQKVKKNSGGLLDTFISKKDYTQYLSYKAIESYMQKQGYSKDDYFAFMQDNVLGKSLEEHEIFNEYKKKFKPKAISLSEKKIWFKSSSYYRSDLKDNSNENKSLFISFLQSDDYKRLESAEYQKRFISYAKVIERDKLNTFIQIYDNTVVILQSPPDKVKNKSNKDAIVKFLGYDWSNRKGDEGIKYVTTRSFTESAEEDTPDGDEKDADVVAAINSIKYIATPLYNPNDAWDRSKFAFAIRKHIYNQCRKFSFGACSVPNEYIEQEYEGGMNELLSSASLADMIDFSRNSFDKSIKLTADRKVEIVSKYPLVKLGGSDGICDIRIGGTPSRKNMAYFGGTHPWVSIAEMNGQVITDTKEKITDAGIRNSNVKLIPKGTTLLSFKLSIGKTAIAGIDLYTNEAIAALIPKDKKQVSDKYLFALFSGKLIDLENVGNKAFGKSLNSTYLNNDIKIPLPPPDIQLKIVQECEKVDKEYHRSRMSIEEYKAKIAAIFARLEIIIKNQGGVKISELCDFVTTRTSKIDLSSYVCTDNMLQNFEGVIPFEGSAVISSAIQYMAGDILISNIRPYLRKIWHADRNGACSPDVLVLRPNLEKIDTVFLYYSLRRDRFFDFIMEDAGTKGMKMPRGNKAEIIKFEIAVPSPKEQQSIVEEISHLDKLIQQAQNVIENCDSQKQDIVRKYIS
ncbi:MAG: N-6 DNA methylase [Bacteroidales bacterium]|nr:N-6 DNA methylase [Bacteroidales bacterium]